MSKLIIGCGYLGERVARRWLAAGHEVSGLIRRDTEAGRLANLGIRPILADVTQPETVRGLPAAETVLHCVGYDPASGRSRSQVYVDGLRNVLDALAPTVQRVVLISSTGVFGEANGHWVNEDSPCRPTRETARILLEAEQLLAAHRLGSLSIALRLAGLYGRGRLPRISAPSTQSGQPMLVPPGHWVNLIHVDDAASVVLAAEAHAKPPRTYVVSDGQPVDRREYLRCLAELTGAPPPCFVDAGGGQPSDRRGSGDKRIDNRRMLEELGVRLIYPSYREGLAASVGPG